LTPTAARNPYDTDIVWGNTVSGPNSNFFQSSVDATATGDTVTLWLFATQSAPSDPNGVYWDDAYLYVGGGGGSVPGVTPAGTPVSGVPVVPTSAPPAVAGFVNPQAPQADGSIIHVVQTGDTLASIAFAYGITLEQLQLQNNISNPRFISVGQRLIIRAADDEGDAAEDDDDAVAESDDPPADDATAAPTTEGDSEPAPTAEDAAPAPTNAPPVVAVAPTDAAPAPVRQVSQDGLDPSQTTSTLCVVMFEDSNQNRLQEEGESLLADGTITLTDGTETIGDETTDDSAEICFDDIVPGSYVAAGSAPDGYGLTTPDQLQVRVFPGETLYLAFGAAQGLEVAAAPTADSQIGSQPDNETAPLTPETRIDSPMNMLIDNSGLIVFGLAGIVMIFGVGVTMFGLMRRR
jgi:LysM repeat protein